MNMDHRAEEMKEESEIGDTQPLLPIQSSLTEASTAFSFDYSVNSSSSSSSSREKYDDGVNIEMITKLTEERDQARNEAREAKLVVSNIMEVVQILTRQIKRLGSSDFAQMQIEPIESFCSSSELSIGDENFIDDDLELDFDIDLNKVESGSGNKVPERTPLEENHGAARKRTFSAFSVASYTDDENKKCSDLLLQSFNNMQPEFSKIGSDLIALNGACRTIEQNARLIGEESMTMLQDLHLAHSDLDELDDRCTKAEQCAKKLYKENKILKRDLKTSRAERKIMKREIKILMDEKKEREGFQRELLENLKAHENIMIEKAASAKGFVSGDCTAINSDQQFPTSKDLDFDAPNANDEDKIKSSGQNQVTLSPFGKFLSALNTSSMPKKPAENDANILDLATSSGPNTPFSSSRTGSNTPVTSLSPSLSSCRTGSNAPITSLSPSLATMLQAPNFNDDDPSVKYAALQLTPTGSSCESIKSALSAQDLTPSEPHETGLKPFSKDASSWKQRQVNSSGPPAKTKMAVVTVKMPVRNQSDRRIVTRKVQKGAKKQYKHYTIGAK